MSGIIYKGKKSYVVENFGSKLILSKNREMIEKTFYVNSALPNSWEIDCRKCGTKHYLTRLPEHSFFCGGCSLFLIKYTDDYTEILDKIDNKILIQDIKNIILDFAIGEHKFWWLKNN